MSKWEVIYKRTDGKEGKRSVLASSSNEAEAKVKRTVRVKWAYRISVRFVK